MTEQFTETVVLVDTSSWFHFLRPGGDAGVRTRVEAALSAGTARWCPPELPITDAVWDAAYALAQHCRTAGVTVPATDLLIHSCARHHGAIVDHADSDFDEITRVAQR